MDWFGLRRGQERKREEAPFGRTVQYRTVCGPWTDGKAGDVTNKWDKVACVRHTVCIAGGAIRWTLRNEHRTIVRTQDDQARKWQREDKARTLAAPIASHERGTIPILDEKDDVIPRCGK